MKIAICDTDAKAMEIVDRLIGSELSERKEEYYCEKYLSAISLLDDISGNRDFDACFLHAEMTGMNGIDVTKELKKYRPACMVILYSTSETYAVAAWSVDAFFYLLMPTTRKDISGIISRIQDRINSENLDFLRLKMKDGWYHILYRDILYIESEAHKVNITLTNQRKITTYGKLDRFEEVLTESGRFIRIHKSVLIQGRYIRKFSGLEVVCENGEVFSVSRTAQEKARQQYERYIRNCRITTIE